MTTLGPLARRPGLGSGVANTFTLTWRSVLKIRTNMEDVLGLSLNPIMFLLLFTYVFGGAISGGTHSYLQYELPGILVLSVVFATLGTGLMLNQDISGGVSTASAACRSPAGLRWPGRFSATSSGT